MEHQPTRVFQATLAPRLGPRAAIGLLALSTDATIETEWRRLLDLDGVAFYVTRVPFESHVRTDTLASMEQHLGAIAGDLLDGHKLDVLAYACTSASLVIGEDRVAAALHAGRPDTPVTTPLTAVKAALSAFGTTKLTLLTPYVDEINRPLCDHFRDNGLTVSVVGSFMNDSDPEVVRITPDAIARAARELVAEQRVGALVIACTALRAASLVPELEATLGIPVTTSNHAMAWHAMRLANVADRRPEHGSLFTLPLVSRPTSSLHISKTRSAQALGGRAQD